MTEHLNSTKINVGTMLLGLVNLNSRRQPSGNAKCTFLYRTGIKFHSWDISRNLLDRVAAATCMNMQ